MVWNPSDQSSSSRTSDGNTFSSDSPDTTMSLGEYPPEYDYNSSYPADYAGTGFGSVPFDNIPSPTTQYSYSEHNDTTRVTPTSLGWTPDTQLWKVYEFVVIKGKNPYLDLIPGCNITPETPERVYLDLPRSILPGVNHCAYTDVRNRYQGKGKQSYPCQFPGGCTGKQNIFTRPADLERHYMNVHAPVDNRLSFKCDYGRCQRSEAPFTRKDHYRDHLRDYHKEDLGCAKRDKEKKKSLEWQALQEKWLAERQINPKWWRCVRCLVKVHTRDGWVCGSCKQACETDRREARERLVRDAATVETTSSYTSNCSTCNGRAVIEGMYVIGGWDACPNCQPSERGGEYDIAGLDNSQYPSSSYY